MTPRRPPRTDASASDGLPRRFNHVVFRIQHDCDVSLLSREFPRLDFFTWSVHKQEIVYAACEPEDEEPLRATARRFLREGPLIKRGDGLAWVFHPTLPKSRSISWQLEKAGALWLQPLRCRAGWEYFDVIALKSEGFTRVITRLRGAYPLEIVRRSPLSPADLATSFFVPLSPAVRNLTPKQLEAIRRAHDLGYYTQPRGATTRDVARSLGVSRSAFEERLRNAENIVISGVVSSLASMSRKEDRRGGAR